MGRERPGVGVRRLFLPVDVLNVLSFLRFQEGRKAVDFRTEFQDDGYHFIQRWQKPFGPCELLQPSPRSFAAFLARYLAFASLTSPAVF